MRFINSVCFILGEDEDTSGVMPVTKSSDVSIEKPFTLRGDYSIYDKGKMCAERNIKSAKSCS